MPTQPDLSIPVSDTDHALGPANAPVTLVEYGDYECPDCLNSEPIVRQLREHFGNTLRVVFRHFPQNNVHPHASAAAQAAEAAGTQGKYWEMHQALFEHQKELADLDFTHLALQLGMDPYKFERDTEARSIPKRIRADYESGIASGVTGTPTFFINGRRHPFHKDLSTLIAAIETAQDQ
jgi:protein-disulfide isomerase